MRFLHHTELAAILLPGWCGVKCVVQQTLSNLFNFFATPRFKVDMPRQKALEQIKIRGYAEKYQRREKRLY